MTNARIERLTREALGPRRRDVPDTYTEVDDTLLRGVGIVILVITVIVFAAWPRDEAAEQGYSVSERHADAADKTVPASRPSSGQDASGKPEYSPLY